MYLEFWIRRAWRRHTVMYFKYGNSLYKIVPHVYLKKKADYYNKTVHNILTKEITMILPNFLIQKRVEKAIVALLVTGLLAFAYQGISRYLHNKRQNTIQKAFGDMENKISSAGNKMLWTRWEEVYKLQTNELRAKYDLW